MILTVDEWNQSAVMIAQTSFNTWLGNRNSIWLVESTATTIPKRLLLGTGLTWNNSGWVCYYYRYIWNAKTSSAFPCWHIGRLPFV